VVAILAAVGALVVLFLALLGGWCLIAAIDPRNAGGRLTCLWVGLVLLIPTFVLAIWG